MEDKILVNLATDHIWECSTNIIGREGEGNTTRLEITVPEKLLGYAIYLDFEIPSGDTLRTPKLKVENGVAYYDVVPYLLAVDGEIKVQAVLIKDGKTWKSSTKAYVNLHSINASDDIPIKEDFFTNAQKVLDELSGEIAEIAEALANDEDFIDAVAHSFNTYVGEEMSKINGEIAKKLQLKPEFAESEEWLIQNGDKAKLYVLPVGMIYACMYKEGGTTPNFNNKIPISTDTDGSIYDGDGYASDTYMSSSGSTSSKTGCVASGFIPYTTDKTIYFKGVDLVTTNSYTRIVLYDSSKTKIGYVAQTGQASATSHLNYFFTIEAVDDYFKMTPTEKLATSLTGVAFIRISCGSGVTGDEWIVTVDQPITYTIDESGYNWENTGHAFIPADYEERIIDLEADSTEYKIRITEAESRITKIEDTMTKSDAIPDYWLSELETKANAIRLAMETAGKNKSAFLWYTDSHWTYGNAKVSPILLKYLYKNTPMNKVNFGGDIVVNAQPRENMKYLYDEWRSAIRELPNHHSVVGNHDIMVDYPYTFLIAPEESADMVMGDGRYYYIDNPCEKARYLYLDYLTASDTSAMVAQGQFIVDAISNVESGWHIVVIAHRWFQYAETDTPTVGAIPAYNKEILQIFDEYNSRGTHTASTYFSTQNFASGKGKVEFCIGGHIHVDYDELKSNGGIPIILTASDTNQDRSSDETEDSGTVGTTTESAVFGIIADYNLNKITVVGVGRGGSREIGY